MTIDHTEYEPIDLPDVNEFINNLPKKIRCILKNVVYSKKHGGYTCSNLKDAVVLRMHGLCEYPSVINSGMMLMNYGVKVREALLNKV